MKATTHTCDSTGAFVSKLDWLSRVLGFRVDGVRGFTAMIMIIIIIILLLYDYYGFRAAASQALRRAPQR